MQDPDNIETKLLSKWYSLTTHQQIKRNSGFSLYVIKSATLSLAWYCDLCHMAKWKYLFDGECECRRLEIRLMKNKFLWNMLQLTMIYLHFLSCFDEFKGNWNAWPEHFHSKKLCAKFADERIHMRTYSVFLYSLFLSQWNTIAVIKRQ